MLVLGYTKVLLFKAVSHYQTNVSTGRTNAKLTWFTYEDERPDVKWGLIAKNKAECAARIVLHYCQVGEPLNE